MRTCIFAKLMSTVLVLLSMYVLLQDILERQTCKETKYVFEFLNSTQIHTFSSKKFVFLARLHTHTIHKYIYVIPKYVKCKKKEEHGYICQKVLSSGEKSIFIVKSLVHFNLTQQSQNFCYIRALLYTLCSIIRGAKDCNFWRQNIKSQHFLKFFFSLCKKCK